MSLWYKPVAIYGLPTTLKVLIKLLLIQVCLTLSWVMIMHESIYSYDFIKYYI